MNVGYFTSFDSSWYLALSLTIVRNFLISNVLLGINKFFAFVSALFLLFFMLHCYAFACEANLAATLQDFHSEYYLKRSDWLKLFE